MKNRTKKRAKRRARKKRMVTARSVIRLVSQLTVLIIGGAVAGGLILLLAIPTEVDLPWPALAIGVIATLWITGRTVRRLEPISSRRG